MPLVTTPAIILHVMPYSETSKIVRLLARDLGLQSAIAKGARRAKSRTGPRLDLFAAGTATLSTRGHRELNPLTSFDITSAHAGLSHDVTRFAAASALAELVLKCVPAEPHPEVFDAASAGLDAIEHAPTELLETAALVACWGLVVALGFSPTLDRCAVCGVPTEGAIRFSAVQGGALCANHGTEAPGVTRLKRTDREALAALIAGRLPEAALDPRHAAAHRRLLMAFVRHHLAEDRPLPALAFWDAESWNATSS
ncbi:MAG: DNA repair protein RecO [Gemmatimonadales bacterium]|nr:DNA repair protein RecO [Gemmatimonadales bacterium]